MSRPIVVPQFLSDRSLVVGKFFVLCAAVCAIALPPWGLGSARAGVLLNVSFDDPGGTYAAYYAQMQNAAQAAAANWGQYFHTSGNVTLDLTIQMTSSVPRATGTSTGTTLVGNVGGVRVYEQGAATQVRTGLDPNGAAADIQIQMSPTYLTGELWFDPDPYKRNSIVPSNRTDADSVFLHELGHAFGFNGWKSGTNGATPSDAQGPYESTFDKFETFDGSNLYFGGTAAVARYGGPVPVTYGNNFHLGNNYPRPGLDLIPDLMNGLVFYRGIKYDISALDLMIMKDVGLPVQYPGDANGDGVVNGLDVADIASHWLHSGVNTEGDVNGDGVVNGLDIASVASHWLKGFGGTGASTAAAVPEPASAVLAVISLLGFVTYKRERRWSRSAAPRR